jgi:hypothetical protein
MKIVSVWGHGRFPLQLASDFTWTPMIYNDGSHIPAGGVLGDSSAGCHIIFPASSLHAARGTWGYDIP